MAESVIKIRMHILPREICLGVYSFLCLFTSMIGYQIHGSIFWAIVDFFFAPLVFAKWLLYHQVSLAVIRQTFAFFFN